MNNLSEIVKLINAALLTLAFNTESRQKSALYGISKTLPYKQKADTTYELIPTLLDLDGDGKKLIPDDNNSIQIYHKINSTASIPDKVQYGNTNDKIIRTTQMSMIVWAQSNKINMFDNELDQLMLSVFPNKIAKDKLNEMKLTDCTINYNSTDFNSMAIFMREYATKQYYLNPQHLLFEVKYSIECRLNKSCIKTC